MRCQSDYAVKQAIDCVNIMRIGGQTVKVTTFEKRGERVNARCAPGPPAAKDAYLARMGELRLATSALPNLLVRTRAHA